MERYGPYRCLKPLGAGGMGAVYLAEHESTGARYALKVLAGALDPEDELRFAREAQAMAAAGGHPNVARVHTLDRQGARAYMVLELVEGGDLGELLAERAPLPPYEAVELVVGVARGVHHAHERGVLHRDLKPANVLLDGDGRPKVTDFGLAKLSGADTLTQSGEVLGTPVYMAPEQARGEVGSYDARTDVFGLGGVLFFLLTGRGPVEDADDPWAALSEGPAPSPAAINPLVPAGLDAIVRRALARDADKRYATAEVFCLASGGLSLALAVTLVLGTRALWPETVLGSILLGSSAECLIALGCALYAAIKGGTRKLLFVPGVLLTVVVSVFHLLVLALGMA